MQAIITSLDYIRLAPDAQEADIVIAWHDTTFPKRVAYPVSRWGISPINGRCRDISKRHLGRIYASVFGREITIDPATFVGRCVEKNNYNAQHDVVLRDCPLDAPDMGRVYERYIDSSSSTGVFEDIRIAVVGAEIPVCWRRIKGNNDTAARFDQKFDRSIPVPAAQLLEPQEMLLILRFCQEMGLDFCELDAGRDRDDGSLYIFDANSTPFTRDYGVTEDESLLGIELLAAAFARQFEPGMTIAP